jgi:hypothetical protein
MSQVLFNLIHSFWREAYGRFTHLPRGNTFWYAWGIFFIICHLFLFYDLWNACGILRDAGAKCGIWRDAPLFAKPAAAGEVSLGKAALGSAPPAQGQS